MTIVLVTTFITFYDKSLRLFDILYVEKNALRGGAEQDRPVVRVETQQAQRCPRRPRHAARTSHLLRLPGVCMYC
jgi:hypothetical protein